MNDSLVEKAEVLRRAATANLDSRSQSENGQYFTPARAATLVAGLPRLSGAGDRLRVLDPGAGSGMLMSALVERIVEEAPELSVAITAVEKDPDLMHVLSESARLCETWAAARGVSVTVDVQRQDLIEASTGLGAKPWVGYDVVIMNPPYGKMAVSSSARLALGSIGWDCPNLYAAFLALGVDALRTGGQLVAITPRSFTNGPYFGAFRRRLLDSVAIDRIHTFESRSTVFRDSGVLQENVVFSATRGSLPGEVRITMSRDHTDVASSYMIDYADLVVPSDPNGFIRVVTSAADTALAEHMFSLPSDMRDLGVQVSTGRVVDFRAESNLISEANVDRSDYPLIYSGNLKSGFIDWPRPIGKAQGFRLIDNSDCKALMPGGCYVVVKRFSAKEERRRIVAALWDPDRHGDVEVAFENHLNVFHRNGNGIERELAWGLCLWLNGSSVDRFFRTFSGHTQVNASDLRSLKFPDSETLRRLARAVDVLPEQEELDRLIDGFEREPAAA